MASKIRLLIADDHQIFLDGLALMLSKEPGFKVEGQATNGVQLMELIQEYQPEVVLTDIKMPELNGIGVAHQVRTKFPDVKVIALSMYDQEDQIVEMLEAGAKGYLLKNADKSEIIEAIYAVLSGEVYYCKNTSKRLVSMIARSNFNPYKQKEHVQFNEREIEIIKFICQELTAKEMGEKLFISKRTVEGYRTRILEKMQVRNTAGVVLYALKHHLIKESEML
jgi:DNA-binding NarL/FixJ family response regulator